MFLSVYHVETVLAFNVASEFCLHQEIVIALPSLFSLFLFQVLQVIPSLGIVVLPSQPKIRTMTPGAVTVL